ncbi:rCG30411, isoform CRA_c [Rattus norvegicus]|uniref:RCG30411, isoform CRA_c n=1 Tax=Rattus norvegicus TaxID=10116 RepID=A6JFH6_RAT|nr:rCG30411, isoform CRA_c [Rattus norvegicus]
MKLSMIFNLLSCFHS